MLELADKNIKGHNNHISYIKKKQRKDQTYQVETWKTLKNSKLLRMKTMVSGVKNTLDGINDKLDIVEKRLVNLKRHSNINYPK